MSFSYPGNWAIMKGNKDYDPQANIQLRPVQDARIGLILIALERSSEEAAALATDAIMDSFEALAPAVPFAEWGSYKGAGRSFQGRSEGRTYHVSIFIAPVAETCHVYWYAIVNEAVLDQVQPGLDLIRGTFRCLKD